MVQAVDQAVVHDEIHAAVAADLLGLRLDFHGDRVLVTLHQRLPHLPGHEFVGAQILVVGHARVRKLFGIEGITLDRVFVGEAFRTGQLVHAAVRPRRVDVVFQQDRAALFGLDQRRGVVGIGELRGAHPLPGQFPAVDRPGVHGHEVVHLVAAVYVQQLAGGAEAVRGVDVAAVLLVEFKAPVALVVIPEGIQVVDIRSLDMEDVAEQPLFGHVERRELEEVVDAVFEHHAVAPGLLGGIHQLPAFVERRGGGNLHGDVFALLHGVDGHRDVLLPWSDDVHEIDVVAFAELFPALLTAVSRGFGQSAAHEDRLRAVDPLGVEVAEGFDLDAVEVGEALHGARTAHAQPDEAHADGLHRSRLESQHRLLARFAGRGIEHDHPVDRLVALRFTTGKQKRTRQGAQ